MNKVLDYPTQSVKMNERNLGGNLMYVMIKSQDDVIINYFKVCVSTINMNLFQVLIHPEI